MLYVKSINDQDAANMAEVKLLHSSQSTNVMSAPAKSLDTSAITFEWNMLQRIPAFMHNKH